MKSVLDVFLARQENGLYASKPRVHSTLFSRRVDCFVAALVFFTAINCAFAEKCKVSGVVLDANGKAVAGAQIASFWGAHKGVMKPFDEATTDDQGKFELEVEYYSRRVALLAIDEEQAHGQIILLDPTNSATPVTLRLQPLITLRGEFFCPELDEALAWSNVYVNLTKDRIRLAQDYSVPSTFQLKLPPGEYELNGYGGEEVSGTNLPVILSADKPFVDLGRIDLAATPIGLNWGKPAPAWNTTEARGIGTNVTLADFRGRWLLLDFWGYWCGPCVRAMPELMRFYDDHASNRSQFEILAMHARGRSLREMDERLKPTIKDLWNGRTLPFPILLDATDKTTAQFGVHSFPSQVLIDPDGRIVRDGDVGLLKRILDSQLEPNMPVAASNDGSLLAVASTNSTVNLLEPRTSKCVLSLKCPAGIVHCAAFFPDGRKLATGGSDHTIGVWNLSTGKEVVAFGGHHGAVFALAVSPDGKTLGSAGFDTFRLWDAETGAEKMPLSRRLFPCWSVAFSPDGRQVAAGGVGTVQVWDATTGEEKATLRDPVTDLIHSLCFSPDGRSLAVGRGNTVALWDLATAKRQTAFNGLASEVIQVAFAPDGKTVTALSRGKSIRSWSTISNNDEASAPESTLLVARNLAAQLPDAPDALNAEAWEVVRRSGQSSQLYERAFRQAQIAAVNNPKNKAYLTTLGAAQYRSGQFNDALVTLNTANAIPRAQERWTPPLDRVFQAIALQKLGQTNSAMATALSLWSFSWDLDSVASSLFVEMNETLFGPGAETGRELILKLLAGGKSAAAVETALKAKLQPANGTLATSLGLLPAAESYFRVRKEQKALLLRTRVVQAVEQWTNVGAEQRELALTLAGQTAEDVDQLNDASWAVVSQTGRSKPEYQLALEQAEAAYRLSPNSAIRNTLGVAQYRAGRYQDAIATLIESERASTEAIAAPGDLPFLAMAFQQAGQSTEAKKRFDQLASIQTKTPTQNPEMLRWLNEVEAVSDLSCGGLHRSHF